MSDNSEQAKSWGLHVNEADRFAGLFYYSIDDLHSIPTQELQEIALSGLRERFENLKSKLPMLGKLADEQGVEQIYDINDAAKMEMAEGIREKNLGTEKYRELYRDLRQMYYPRDLFRDYAQRRGLKHEIFDQVLANYDSAQWRFNFYFEKT